MGTSSRSSASALSRRILSTRTSSGRSLPRSSQDWIIVTDARIWLKSTEAKKSSYKIWMAPRRFSIEIWSQVTFFWTQTTMPKWETLDLHAWWIRTLFLPKHTWVLRTIWVPSKLMNSATTKRVTSGLWVASFMRWQLWGRLSKLKTTLP